MLENSDEEEADESSSLLPEKIAHRNNKKEDRKSPHPNHSNYATLHDTGQLTQTDVNNRNGQIESNDFDTASETQGFSFFALPRKQKAVLCSICMADFLSYLCLSLLAPFFPQEVSIKKYTIRGTTKYNWYFPEEFLLFES
jgi:hypothetical protein